LQSKWILGFNYLFNNYISNNITNKL